MHNGIVKIRISEKGGIDVSVIKYIFNTVFRINKISEEDVKSIHIRDVMPILYVISVATLLLLFMKYDNIRESAFKVPMVAIACVFFVFFLVFDCLFNGAILYIVGNFLKKQLNFRDCCKVVLARMIVGGITVLVLAAVQVVAKLAGFFLSESIIGIFNIGAVVYGWGVSLYFLNKFFGYERKDLSVYGAVLFTLWLIPTVGKYILSLIA